ncbi:MAG: sigma-70 family RNA polymerase sigma factor [Oscillospiraceae bacterium]|nr:sigma-70 family RNA polymerase sigma factor [Oscillospiraceae bacterium]
MEDKQIVDLYWARSEKAISETADKYGRYCYTIAYNILHSNEDSEECVNDTYLHAWNAMPDQRPNKLSAFLGRITRNLSLKRWEKYTAKKRGAGQVPLALDELQECIPATNQTDSVADDIVLTDVLNRFLASLTAEKRNIFMRRYWYLSSVAEIASDLAISESKVKMSLLRSRNELKQLLEKEGITL